MSIIRPLGICKTKLDFKEKGSYLFLIVVCNCFFQKYIDKGFLLYYTLNIKQFDIKQVWKSR